MPELPEVETTARYLNAETAGSTIVSAVVRWARTIDRPTPPLFARAVVGRRITGVSRRGKFVVVELEPDASRSKHPSLMLAHMRMSGSFDVVSNAALRGKHEHVILSLDDGREIRFNDPRKFGRFYLVDALDEVTKELGYEPLGDDLTPQIMKALFASRRTPIKSALIDQRFVAGIGNIYADEALWHAGISPKRQARSLSLAELTELLAAIRTVLCEAIEMAGTDFGDNVVHGGGYAPKVYGKGGEPCARCGDPLKRIVLGQRSTHFCGRCQKGRRK